MGVSISLPASHWRDSTTRAYTALSPGKIVLASESPRRAAILTALGIPFDVVAAEVAESLADRGQAAEIVERHARLKAEAVFSLVDAPVLAADTVVESNGELLGKPEDEEEAARMLRRLSGREHRVFTGVAMMWQKGGRRRWRVGHEVTHVVFRQLTGKEIRAYIATGEPCDKAGAYAIQGYGASFVEAIHGCYFNVVGLPVGLLTRFLEAAGLPLWSFWIRNSEQGKE